AALRVRGAETAVTITPIRSSKLTWTSSVNWAMNRSKITKLPVPSFNAAGGTTGAIRIALDSSATALYANDTLGPGHTLELVYQGEAAASWTGGMLNTVQYRAVSFTANIELQRGGLMNVGSWRHWDIARNGYDYEQPGNCGGTTPLGECRLKYQNQEPMNYWL